MNFIRLVCLTFNCGNKSLYDINNNLQNFLNQISNNNSDNYPEILVLSLQECKNTNIQKALKKDYLWINPKDSFIQPFLGNLYLSIFFRKSLLQKSKITNYFGNKYYQLYKISNKISTVYKCSIINQSKGSIMRSILINIKNKKPIIIDFYGAHLPSNPSKIKERNKCLSKSIQKSLDKNRSIIFMGDLNYRTDSNDNSYKNTNIGKLISLTKCNMNNLQIVKDPNIVFDIPGIHKDQLRNTNINLDEPDINFCPTCRLKEGVIDKKNRFYDPKRMLSWCDRILSKNLVKNIETVLYSAYNLSNDSDHLAVYRVFHINF